MSVESILQTALAEVPKCVAAGVVDMESGMLLGVKTVDSHPQEVLDLLSAATKELFEGDTTMTIENMFKKMRGSDFAGHYFKEIIIGSQNLLHGFSRLTSNDGVVVTVVCRADANLGMLMMKLRVIAKSETI